MDYSFSDNSDRQMPGISYIRLLHAAPGAPAIDVYVNDRLVARRLSYGSFTDYVQFDAGSYNFEVYAAGTKVTPILSVNIPLTEGVIYTMAVIGMPPRIGILPIEDGYESFTASTLNTRFINLSPDAPNLDLVLRDGTMMFSDIAYTDVSDYRSMNPGFYSYFVRPTGLPTNLLYFPVRLLPRRNLSFYIIGSFSAQTLKVVIPMDGSTYLRS